MITGVSSGIGQGLAARYLDEGAHVYGISRRDPVGFSSAARFHSVSLDLTRHTEVPSVITELLGSKLEQLDLVVLNAGRLGEIADIGSTSLESLKDLMDVNVWANKTLLDTLLTQYKIRQVIAISSGAAVNGNRGWNGYSISKAALNMLVSLYAAEYPETHFAAVAPGLVDTAMQEYLCNLPHDDRFPSIDRLRVARGTHEMPTPTQLAPRLIALFNQIPTRIESGDFVDLRNLPEQFSVSERDAMVAKF